MMGGEMFGGWANHLWQSTVFAGAAALLTLAFRKNRAQVRYGLWLGASLKFLVPFSVLLALGGRLWDSWAGGKIAETAAAAPAVSQAVVQITQPFSERISFAPAAAHTTNWILIAAAVWACGFLGVALARMRGWLRIRAAVRASSAADIAMPVTMEVRSTPMLLEPGVVGLLRPVLLLPEGILKNLTRPQLAAVLAHEQCHVRRRDNLTATIHMLVEAIFWFYPVVWWIGARLMEERERACDEAVLSLGNEPQAYAEGILNVCQSYLESPLRCVSGVTGSDLKKRIRAIMSRQVAGGLSVARKVTLAIAAVAAIAAPILAGMIGGPSMRAQAQRTGTLRFEVAAIKPPQPGQLAFGVSSWSSGGSPGSTFRMLNTPLKQWVEMALSVSDYALKAPSWLDTARFDLDARIPPNAPANGKFLNEMMRNLLVERFGLKWHEESRIVSGYELVQGKKLLLKASDLSDPKQRGGSGWGPALINGHNMAMSDLATKLGEALRIPVVDDTHLSGGFEIDLKWHPDDAATVADAKARGMQDMDNLPPLFTALQEQLGLKLQRAQVPFNVIVVDNIDRQPTAN